MRRARAATRVQASWKVEHAGDVGGDELADGVAEQQVGARPQALEQAKEGDLQGEEAGLGEGGLVEQARRQRSRRRRRRRRRAEGGRGRASRCGADGVEGVAEDGKRS